MTLSLALSTAGDLALFLLAMQMMTGGLQVFAGGDIEAEPSGIGGSGRMQQ